MEKKYDFNTMEKEMQQLWEGLYSFQAEGEGEVYSIDTPPPTVSGQLHIGHIFSYTQAEMIARFQRMQGKRVFYPFGFDDNGLPTERLVEREEGIKAKDVSRAEFVERCRAVSQKYEDEFKTLWKSMGFSVDWSLQYETNSPTVEKISQSLFLELAKSGKTYMKESPVLWCTECQTSIAQAELDAVDAESSFNYIVFKLKEECNQTIKRLTNESQRGDLQTDESQDKELIVATTRPELLAGCVCLFVHPSDQRFSAYIGKTALVPLYDFEIPILADEDVSLDKGTGIVMCATFGDSTDVDWYAKHQLPYRKVILQDGSISQDIKHIGGMRIKAARAKIIEILHEKQLLLRSETITHSTPIHERCGTHVEIIPSKQWYIDILSEKERFIQAAEEINWYPSQMKNRYLAWVENLKWDWCISRQRYFGIHFPLWYCKACGQVAFAKEEDLPLNPLEQPYTGTCACGCQDFVPEAAVLDTWATSSVTPQINERLGIQLVPMSMRTHAHEIIRTWTFYTIVRSLYHTGQLPWKDLMISGFVLAGKGEKISKSKNNASLSPKQLIESHSADALRYWAASAKLGTDSYFSEEELRGSKRFLTKLWNASKFALSHLEDMDIHQQAFLPVDRWIMERSKEVIGKATRFLKEYEVGAARHEIDQLFWRDFCDHYIEIVKERLYLPDIHGEKERQSGQAALYYSLLTLLKLYAIYVPHITEAIYLPFFKDYEKSPSIHLLRWEQAQSPDEELLGFGERLKECISLMRKQKAESKLSIRTELDVLTIETEEKYASYFELSINDIKACSNAKRIEIKLL